MSLEHIWAGWRSEYFEKKPADSCVLCALPNESDEDARIIVRGETVYVVMNLYPYTSGHMMVVPKRHVANLDELNDVEAAELWQNIAKGSSVVKETLSAQGLNVGFNLGKAAGAGFADHLHAHIVPRWSGDTNFMTPIADARVLPEPLDVTAERLRSSWKITN